MILHISARKLSAFNTTGISFASLVFKSGTNYIIPVASVFTEKILALKWRKGSEMQ